MSRRRRQAGPSGVVVVDKPGGMTSHDVVRSIRKRLNTRRVGHAGTLDPMATGVLVIMVGEATKLAPYLTAQDKSYEARVQLGAETDTLDAEGTLTERAALPNWLSDETTAADRLEAALESERARTEQLPPAFSAIRIGGKRSYDLARAGNAPKLEPRQVAVRSLSCTEQSPDGWFDLKLTAAKGYYVRSLARDLGRALETPAHLSRLRRTASGAFDIGRAVAWCDVTEDDLIPIAQAATIALPHSTLTSAGASKASTGALLGNDDFHRGCEQDQPTAWLSEDGELIAIGSAKSNGFAVLRGFNTHLESTS